MNANTNRIGHFITQNAIYIVLVVLVITIAIKNPDFLSVGILRDILLQCSTRAIIALGAGFVLITAGTDLSAGRVVGFTAVLSASMLQLQDYPRRFFPDMPDLPLWLPIVLAIAAGLIVGLINGFIVSKLSVPPFIATLGTMVAVYGINSIYFDMKPNQSQPIGGLRHDFTNLGTGFIGKSGPYSIPYIVIIAIVIAAIVWVIFNKTRLGKNMYAIGGNMQAAKVSGINVSRNLMAIYAIAGALYGLAGVLIFGVINYGLTFIGVSPYWQLIIKGLIIVAAVAFDIRKYLSKK
jgi:methyl-galactoside transport system permease protein